METKIENIVSDYTGIPVPALFSKLQKREIVQERQRIMFFYKMFTKNSLSTIGEHCGGKDHATVLHALKTVSNLIDTDSKFREETEELRILIDRAVNSKELVLMINDNVWIKAMDNPVNVDIINIDYRYNTCACVPPGTDKRYHISMDEIYLVNPDNLYLVAYIDNFENVNFEIKRIMEKQHIVFFRVNLESIEKLKEFINTSALYLVDLNYITYNDGFKNHIYALCVSEIDMIEKYKQPVVFETDNIYQVYTYMKELLPGNAVSVAYQNVAFDFYQKRIGNTTLIKNEQSQREAV